MARFAILRHESPRGLHWDFLLEMGERLKTWALPEEPRGGGEMDCQELPDHRPAYLDYEGPVSGGRGSVTRWDQGTYQIERQSESELLVRLFGEKLAGRVLLSNLPDEPGRWRFSLA